jgi:hypothetical protein
VLLEILIVLLHPIVGFGGVHWSSQSAKEEEVHWWKQVLDPKRKSVQHWNKLFVLSCFFALFVDPLFFFAIGINRVCCKVYFVKSVAFSTWLEFFCLHAVSFMPHYLDFFSPSTYNITIGNQILFHPPKLWEGKKRKEVSSIVTLWMALCNHENRNINALCLTTHGQSCSQCYEA